MRTSKIDSLSSFQIGNPVLLTIVIRLLPVPFLTIFNYSGSKPQDLLSSHNKIMYVKDDFGLQPLQ